MWRHVNLVWTDVSEERIASIFRVEKSASEEPVCSHLLTLVPHSRIFLPWRWRRYIPPKCRFAHDLHGAISQKTAFFLFKADWDVGMCVPLIAFPWKFCVSRNSVKGIFITDSINETYGGVCRSKYPNHTATSHPTLITFYSKITHQLKFIKEQFCLKIHQKST
jgi:hypothetical protein